MNIKECKALLKYSKKLEDLNDDIKETEKFIRAIKKATTGERVRFSFVSKWGGFMQAKISAKFCREKILVALQEELKLLKTQLKKYPKPPTVK